MSVPAEDELLRQSLEQSLCPNEEDSTDSTPAPTSGLGSTLSVVLQRELMILLLVSANGRWDMCSSYVCTSRTGEGEGDLSEEQEGGDAVTVMQLVSYSLLEQTAHSTSDCRLQILPQLVLSKGQRLLLLLNLI